MYPKSAEIQQQLSRKGDNAGSADGIWGPSTARAVKKFQNSKGLATTGNLNIETIQAWGMPGSRWFELIITFNRRNSLHFGLVI